MNKKYVWLILFSLVILLIGYYFGSLGNQNSSIINEKDQFTSANTLNKVFWSNFSLKQALTEQNRTKINKEIPKDDLNNFLLMNQNINKVMFPEENIQCNVNTWALKVAKQLFSIVNAWDTKNLSFLWDYQQNATNFIQKKNSYSWPTAKLFELMEKSNQSFLDLAKDWKYTQLYKTIIQIDNEYQSSSNEDKTYWNMDVLILLFALRNNTESSIISSLLNRCYDYPNDKFDYSKWEKSILNYFYSTNTSRLSN